MKLKEQAANGERPESAQTEGGGKGKKKKKKTEVDKKIIEEIETKSKNVEEEINSLRTVWETEKAELMQEKENVQKECSEL